MFGKINEAVMIDEVKTKVNVRKLLSKYRSMARIAGINFGLQSPMLSDMPKRPSQHDRLEKFIIKKIEAERGCAEILAVLELLPNKEGSILKYSYCMPDKYTMNEIAAKVPYQRVNEFGEIDEIYYSVKNIERLKSKALLSFAQGYRSGILMVYK